MTARDTIEAIRDGAQLPQGALLEFADGLATGAVSDAQAGAFAMAVLLRGLDRPARTELTLGMRDSGKVLSWAAGRPVLDKHSTGGIGDCVSLVLAPALAACGACVPMISGRGLGHTGGTLDKLEAIPGVGTDLPDAKMRLIVENLGVVIAAANTTLAPADRRLYAIRDVSATVESLDLITASILSKKLAAGLQGLVLDVTVGSGAFMRTLGEARALADALVETANAAGCRTGAIISDMNQPLAPAAGNAVEVASAMEVITGVRTGPLHDLTCTLGGAALRLGGLCDTEAQGAERIAEAIGSGTAAEIFGRMIAAMGGPIGFVDSWARFLPEATVIREVKAPRDGYIGAIDGTVLGRAVVGLGGGRNVETDRIDPAVGLSDILPLGTPVTRGQPLLRLHASRSPHADAAEAAIGRAIEITDTCPEIPPLVHDRIGL
ncbi:thymidine phosphorylase [Roseovarius aestuariivivens]|uniref:thymidine phosphorylase n=1 Tax=Roseovarius aestuariivivens TaxID=1888910 RepID=UPI0010807701|nr:thymidine phosphorylase [Roseovarius aestuariivivens]